MISTLIIFDIDGTLIKENKASKVAYTKAVNSYFGIRINLSDIVTSGKTDLQIFNEVLVKAEIKTEQIEYNGLIQEYLKYLKRATEQDPGIILPGVKSLLDSLLKQNSIRLALGTGNIERGAKIKLSIHNLDSYFSVGGFGTDAVQRADIVSVAILKAQRKHATRFQRIVVVGDTPEDIESAKINNVHSIAVATGPFSLNELELKQPSFVLKDLKNTNLFLSLLDSLPFINRKTYT
jgi:phosphoglycolate phosphatase